MKKHVQIIGSGQMGVGIAEVCLKNGYIVSLIDPITSQLEKARSKLEKNLSSDELKNCFFQNEFKKEKTFVLIEAIVENLDIKKKLWTTIKEIDDQIDIIASNTSSFSITELASTLNHPEKFIGLHFMNPVPKMPLVEIIEGARTSASTKETSLDFLKSIQKNPIFSKDRPGFVVNRLLLLMINEAIFALDLGIATKEDIDQAMVLGCHHPMGPLALADLIGLDTCLAILKDLHNRLGEDKYRPCPILFEYVHAGKLGRKTKEGFFLY